MLALCYRLRADPLVKGPQWTKCFDNSLFFVFYKKVLQPINYFFLEILFLFEHPFFYLPFLKRMVLIKGSKGRAEGPQWTKCLGKFSLLCFLEKGFCNPWSKDFRNFIFFCLSIFISSFFERILSKGFDKGAEGPQWTKCFCKPSTILF